MEALGDAWLFPRRSTELENDAPRSAALGQSGQARSSEPTVFIGRARPGWKAETTILLPFEGAGPERGRSP